MNNQAKIKLEKIKKLKLPEKVRATADKIEKGLSSADEATKKKAEDALNKLYEQRPLFLRMLILHPLKQKKS